MGEAGNPIFAKRWLMLGLGVILLAAVFIRLGFWQLDRLSQRRAYNALLTARVNQPAVDLTQNSVVSDPAALEYRMADVTGTYDFSGQVALRSQVVEGQVGVDLLTPLIVAGTHQAVLVDRGWIPAQDLHRDAWTKYDQPGQVTVHGMLRMAQGGSGSAIPMTGGTAAQVDLWGGVALSGIQKQVSEPLLPVYIQAGPQSDAPALPQRQAPQLDLSEGPHLGYAIEWFSFAGIVLIGFALLVQRQRRRASKMDTNGLFRAANGDIDSNEP
jgi:surfeit locus 1 family protein